jgi:hypothetical protein
LFDSRHNSDTISCLIIDSKGGKFGYAANRLRTEGRKKPPGQGYCSARRSKHQPACRSSKHNFQERHSSAQETSPSDCRRAQTAIRAHEKTLGGEKEKRFVAEKTPSGGSETRRSNKADVIVDVLLELLRFAPLAPAEETAFDFFSRLRPSAKVATSKAPLKGLKGLKRAASDAHAGGQRAPLTRTRLPGLGMAVK